MKYLSFDIGIKNLAYCLLDEGKQILDWGVINIIEDATKKSLSISELCNLLWDKLDQNEKLLEANIIIIENQPSLKNPKMKTIQILVLSYFVAQQRTLCYEINEINSFAPRNKLDVYKGDKKDFYLSTIKSKNKYNITKKLGILFTKEMISEQSKWLDYLNNSKKKDDLADSYLQGMCFISRRQGS